MLHVPDSIYQSLLEINNILVREVTPEGFFNSLAAILQSKIGCDRVSLTIYESATDSLAWFAKAAGIGVTCMDSGDAPLRGHLARNAIATAAPIVSLRLEDFADEEAIRLMVQAGLRSSMAFPLTSRGRTFGAVVVSFLRRIDEEETFLRDFMGKTCSQVALAVDNMVTHAKLNQQNEYLNQQVDTLLSGDDMLHSGSRFFFNCTTMQNLISQVRLLAISDAPVLICGETGTGKEFIARFIHRFSARASHNFIKVNCPALSPTLFESELFGHVKGAFTGASSKRLGRFELADKGSIFLDEIGDLDIVLQAKLLHVLQDARFERVGESRAVNIDTRCISATNADLRYLMCEGRFRRDLFYRLGVTTVQVPPLRDRENEVIPMLHYLIRVYAEDMHCAPPVFHPDTLKMLEDYHWPGNVRELSNLLARLLILHPGAKLGPEHVRPLLEQGQPFTPALPKAAVPSAPALMCQENVPASSSALADVEKAHIEHVLALVGGRVSGNKGAAKLLGLPRSTLQYKLRKHGITPRDFMKRGYPPVE
ncbi:MAG: sigma-54-dependent Fis family transcriptional regulator [Desulfovibrionales bacterium]|nr:sigma-54-dependent Fis family transcriptional regulator [Desulfovibrionales bacterium]